MASFTRFYALLATSLLMLKCIFALRLPSEQAATCIQSSAPAFRLLARYKDAPASTIALHVIDVNSILKASYGILSTCSACTATNTLENGAIFPKSASNPNQRTISYSLIDGDSPVFLSRQFLPPATPVYCFTDNVVDPVAGAPVLAANGDTERWALCSNSTAGGRVDVVWAPRVGHPHYVKDDCNEVYIEQV
ncbi:hypothetical protein FPV67DRAFT_443180 [Lyophyllum atratum]|nr:hypothetical protein FPV67DRAFT_443180 [Lyophyllum atratum]